jgi:DDE superfamily endonuclease.
VQRTSEAVSGSSACVSEADIRKWFKDINSYLISKNLTINDPSRIYNGDESGFQICPETGTVFARKGAKNVYSVEKGSSKESITVMFSFSASGLICPPMIVYPYKRIPEKISQTVKDPDWGIGRSDNGWMTAETFYEYVKNIFHPFLVKNNIQFPVILFLDGHKSHLTYELSRLCNELNIEVLALYPNATRILQPCDVAVFRPIKTGWKKAAREFYEQNPGAVLNKITFAPLLEKVVANDIKRETLCNGFRGCGLFPFNPDAVDYTKCLGNKNELPEVPNYKNFFIYL